MRIDTSYPFEDRVRVTITPARTATFTLRLRIPGLVPGDFTDRQRAGTTRATTWNIRRSQTILGGSGDWVDICFDIPCRLVHWRGADFGLREPGVVVQRGPLTFALPVPEVWRRFDPPAAHPCKSRESSPTACRVLPAEAAAWNYALCIDPDDPARSFKLVALGAQGKSEPWQSPPIGLLTKARRVTSWLMDALLLTRKHPACPRSPLQDGAGNGNRDPGAVRLHPLAIDLSANRSGRRLCMTIGKCVRLNRICSHPSGRFLGGRGALHWL